MSRARDVDKLVETIRSIERLLIREGLPDQPVLYELDDGSEDIERFKRDYGCTPDEALERGATHIVMRINFNNPANIQPREAYAKPVDPNYVPVRVNDAPKAGEYIAADEPVVIEKDPLVAALLSQACDNADSRDEARREYAANQR